MIFLKKITVDQSLCLGCYSCVGIDPEHFEFEDGLSKVISNENLNSTELLNAIDSCPTDAIKITEENECENNECNCGDNCNCSSNCGESNCCCHE